MVREHLLSYGALRPHPVTFSVAFRGLTIPAEPVGGYIPRALATILSARCMFLGPADGEGFHPPTSLREVFAFDKRVSCRFAFRALSFWFSWRLSEGGSVATISFDIGICATDRRGMES